MATGAALILTMPGQCLAQRKVAQFRLVTGQHGNRWRRRRNVLTEQSADDPITALDRAGSQAWRVFGEKDRHWQETATPILAGVIHTHPLIRPETGHGHPIVSG